MTEIHDKKFNEYDEEIHEINKHTDANVQTIRESVKNINRYLDLMFFTFVAAFVILFAVDIIAMAVLLK